MTNRTLVIILLLTLIFCSLAAQDELILPYDATSLTDEQRAMNPTYLAYPTSIADQMPLQNCGSNYTPMPFTINADGDQVYFSPGNLQYNAARGAHLCADGTTQPGTWRFAEHQYDYVGDATNGNVYWNGVKCDNSLISATYDGWIDLFSWGTSGWNSGANAYQPWATSSTESDYYPSGAASNSLTGAYANADWGIYNQIGSDPAGTWRTLTYDEWYYLFNTRENAANLRGQATINGVIGFLLMPDGWTASSGISFKQGTDVGFSTNSYTLTQWEAIEASGVVFIPASGMRLGYNMGLVQLYGYYWSTTAYTDMFAWYFYFNSDEAKLYGYGARYSCFSVRLVQDIKRHNRFSVAENRQVKFSPGNLQYNAALGSHLCADGTTQPGTWRFAEHQYDYVGDFRQGNVYWNEEKCNNYSPSETYDGWIDLFGWGTSGWDSGANAYQPWSTSDNGIDYYPGGDKSNNLTGTYANADWGVYNQIGSDPAGTWRTLTCEEWTYLFDTRDNAANLRGQAIVNGVNGFLLMPDGWEVPLGISFTAGNKLNFEDNVYSLAEWEDILKPSGAVFLPAGGQRSGSTVLDIQTCGRYWSSSQATNLTAYFGFYASRSYAGCSGGWYGNFGFNVRLVQDVE